MVASIARSRSAGPRAWAYAFLLALVFVASPGAAHEVPPSAVTLDIGRRIIDVKLSLPVSELGSALSLPVADQAAGLLPTYESRIATYVRDRIQMKDRNGNAYGFRMLSMDVEHTSNANWASNDWLVVRARLDAPPDTSTEVFALDYTVIVQQVASHEIFVYVEHDLRNGLVGDKPHLVGVMGFGKTHLLVDGSNGSWWAGFRHLFALGMQHIVGGTDHLLFLLVLLLASPCLAVQGRWRSGKSLRAALRSVVSIAGGFTVGHSLTLALASAGWVHLPTRLVEVLVAASILISSVHALRPLFAGRELWIASGFGLVHGLAFASMLSGLSFDGATLAVSLLGFNLGIECMQLLVIAATLPLLVALSKTWAYTPFRLGGAAFGAVCAAGWLAERVFLATNPLSPLVNWLADPPRWVIGSVCVASGLSLIGLLLHEMRGRRHGRPPRRPMTVAMSRLDNLSR